MEDSVVPRDDIIDWHAFQQSRATLGAAFVRIIGYFREDGAKSLHQIETAMREDDSRGLVLPAHTLKGESFQFGATRLALAAEEIEMKARRFVELQSSPAEIIPQVVALRPLFEATLAAIDAELSPLVNRQRSSGFGRRAEVANQGFGRL